MKTVKPPEKKQKFSELIKKKAEPKKAQLDLEEFPDLGVEKLPEKPKPKEEVKPVVVEEYFSKF